MFHIKFYQDTKGNQLIKEYLLELARKTDKSSRIKLNKIDMYMETLRKYGTRAGMPYVKFICDGIWELRPLNDRFFFFYWKDSTFILLHHFVKKTRKTPFIEIEKAKNKMDDFIQRSKNDEK